MFGLRESSFFDWIAPWVPSIWMAMLNEPNRASYTNVVCSLVTIMSTVKETTWLVATFVACVLANRSLCAEVAENVMLDLATTADPHQTSVAYTVVFPKIL